MLKCIMIIMSEEFIDTASYTGGEISKRKAWSSWAQNHLREMRVAKEAGLFPKSEGWRNTVEHSLTVNASAVLLGRKIQALGHPIDLTILDQASILHDIAKRRDKEAKISRDQEHQIGYARRILQQNNYPEKVILGAEYSGRVAEIYLPEEEQIIAIDKIPLENLIVAYADARVRNTNLVPLEEARDKNKEKIPGDAPFYDKWYQFYKKVEDRVFSLTEESFRPSDLNDMTVNEMVENEYSARTNPI
jgi:hypothetical protein